MLKKANKKGIKSVKIVSAYGRGAYLAHQLQNKGVKSTVLDVSSLLPALSSPEREGPFGVFLPSDLNDLQKQYLCGDNFYPVQQGFSVFTSLWPFEFQGPLRPFFLKAKNDFQLCYSALSPEQGMDTGHLEKKKIQKMIKKCKESAGLLHLAAELTDSYREPAALVEDRDFSPLFSDYIFRESSQRYFSDLKNSLQEEGVEWISVDSKEEVVSLTGDIKKRKDCSLVWTLSGPETEHHFPDYMSFLFPGWKAPVKTWRRFSLSWDQGDFKNVIPSLLLVWSGYSQKKEGKTESLYCGSGGLLSLKKNPASSSIDLWLLCSYAERFNEQTLSTCLESALEQLKVLFPDFSIEGFLPKENSCHDYFVLYEGVWKGRKGYKKSQPYLLNPEAAGKMDAYSLMQQSHRVLENLLK